eukprot:CAMPEP_0171295022 /NCGR_PEP_ID=MMETSP0816-20121228/3609_1 /TAXON_ID=420281 /ORGANISM="Proboscia inermis, Strain CCAP1064/1" /LENGTH=171 /DNA_ID=CAMNT_0011767367 /DNA_START=59 /DNA_END=574 /DNA_ORIENTATION=-
MSDELQGLRSNLISLPQDRKVVNSSIESNISERSQECYPSDDLNGSKLTDDQKEPPSPIHECIVPNVIEVETRSRGGSYTDSDESIAAEALSDLVTRSAPIVSQHQPSEADLSRVKFNNSANDPKEETLVTGCATNGILSYSKPSMSDAGLLLDLTKSSVKTHAIVVESTV